MTNPENDELGDEIRIGDFFAPLLNYRHLMLNLRDTRYGSGDAIITLHDLAPGRLWEVRLAHGRRAVLRAVQG